MKYRVWDMFRDGEYNCISQDPLLKDSEVLKVCNAKALEIALEALVSLKDQPEGNCIVMKAFYDLQQLWESE